MSEAYTMSSPGQLTGLILAGGRGRRMGGCNKGLIEVAGRPLVMYAADILSPHVQQLLVCSNDHHQCYQRLGYRVIDDGEFAGKGPLAGILAGIRAAHTPWLVIAPCDIWKLPDSVYPALIEAAMSSAASMSVAADAQRIHPLCAVIHQRVASSLEKYLLSGELRAGQWFIDMNAAQVLFADVEFDNLNTREDLSRINQTK